MTPKRFAQVIDVGRPRRASAFSLVELLTVIFIISALIAILVPSLSAARNQAKKTVTKKALDSIKIGLEMFKTENEKGFRRTNGYPPSFEYPKIAGVAFDPYLGQFPFLPDTTLTKPVVYGAQWLPAMLIGVDAQGYISRKNVPASLRTQPNVWYDPLAVSEPLKRDPLYVDPGGVNLVATKDLPGKRPAAPFFPEWDETKDMPVIADAFDYPILYYVASRTGRMTNMVGDSRDPNNKYDGEAQERGVPFYFHEDNAGFTGTEDEDGWDFQGLDHPMRISGAADTADKFFSVNPDFEESFARRIVDRAIYRDLELKDVSEQNAAPLRPVNIDSYILVSPGVDGLYGTTDDISNIADFID